MKESIVKMKEGMVPDSYQIFLSGPGGTGKSYVIKMIYRDNIKFFRRFFLLVVIVMGCLVVMKML